MTVRVILGSVLAAVVLFFWGFVYWTIVAMMISPWKPIAADADPNVIATLKRAFPESGVYMYPWVDTAAGDQSGLQAEFEAQHAEGPLVQVFYHASGVPAEAMGQTMGYGFCQMLASALLCCVLLAVAEPSCCYAARVLFVCGLGVFSTLWIEGANVIWWHYPLSHAGFMAAYSIAAWLLAGLVIAAIVKKPRPAA